MCRFYNSTAFPATPPPPPSPTIRSGSSAFHNPRTNFSLAADPRRSHGDGQMVVASFGKDGGTSLTPGRITDRRVHFAPGDPSLDPVARSFVRRKRAADSFYFRD